MFSMHVLKFTPNHTPSYTKYNLNEMWMKLVDGTVIDQLGKKCDILSAGNVTLS